MQTGFTFLQYSNIQSVEKINVKVEKNEQYERLQPKYKKTVKKVTYKNKRDKLIKNSK